MPAMTKTVITGADVKNTLNGEFPLDEFEIVQFEINGTMFEGTYCQNEDESYGWYAFNNLHETEEQVDVPEGTPVFWLMLPSLKSLYEEEHPEGIVEEIQ